MNTDNEFTHTAIIYDGYGTPNYENTNQVNKLVFTTFARANNE